MPSRNKKLLIVINVDWYFLLHWLDRAEAAREAGYEVHIAMGITSAANLARARERGLTVHPLPLARKSVNPLIEARTILALGRIMSAVDPAIVHTATIKPNIYGGLVSRRRGYPVVASVTGLGTLFSGSSRSVKRRILNAMYRAAFKVKRGVVFFENHEDLDMMVRSGIVDRSRARKIAGSGVDTALFRPEEENLGPPFRILFAARLLKDKGLHELVAAVRSVRSHGHEVALQVAGIIDNDVLAAIPTEQLKQWDAGGDINWLGQRDDMPALIAGSNVVCLPTRYPEGIPRVLIEGASSGRALIATDVPGCREIVIPGETGLLVAPNSVEDLADAITRLFLDPDLRKRLGANGRNLAENQYSREIVCSQTLAAYAELLGDR